MKVGILTFQFADNYGALLQAYALKKYISQDGNLVDIMNYANKKLSEAYDVNHFNFKNAFQLTKSLILYPFRRSQASLFKKFRKEKLGIPNPKDLSIELKKDYDCYIVGSDQVWNSKITFDDYNYFLATISSKTVRKVSYAASADDNFLMDINCNKKINLLKRFDAISVRESHMSDILKEKAAIKSEVVLDPVFLLPVHEWRGIAKRPKLTIHKKYILYYALKQNESLDELARHLSQEIQLPIIIVHPTLRKITTVGFPSFNIGPEEFIWLIENADVVVSNSFHAFSFAYIFRKKIYFDYTAGSSNRILNLITMLDLKVARNGSTYYIDMNGHDEVLFKSWLNQSKMFIEKNIGSTIKGV